MRVNTYKLQLTEDKRNEIVKERGVNYAISNNMLLSPDSIVDMLNSVFQLNKQAQEHLYLLCFDTKMHLIGVSLISKGTVNASLVSNREIFINSLLQGASNIVLVHNHPSGITTPSSDDIRVSNSVFKAGELMNVHLVDFIVVGEDYTSFKSMNILN